MASRFAMVTDDNVAKTAASYSGAALMFSDGVIPASPVCGER